MKAHILVLDTEEPSRQALCDLLTRHDYGVSCSDTCDDLMEQIAAAEADCLFLSHREGNAECMGVIRKVQGEPALGELPIIVVSDEKGAGSRIDALKAGASAFITRPLNEEELLTQLAVHLRRRRLQLELHQQLEINQSLLRQLQTDLALGQQVQQSFLPPQQLRTENFRLEARLIAGGNLSGDYFDYKLVTPERLAIFLADVSGHGVASALLASRLKAFFDENYRRAHRPRVFMEQLNRVLIELGEHYHIATAACLHIDVVETVLVYASAGHRTLYWLDEDTGTHEELPTTGPALGMFDEFELVENTHGFLPGRNRIVLFTDGLVEFKLPDGSWITEATFRDKILLAQARLPSEEYVAALLTESRNLTHKGSWDDDVSLLVVDF